MHEVTQGGAARRALWPIDEFCSSHGISKTTAYDLLSSGALTAVKVGRRSLLTAESVERWRASLPAFESGTPLQLGSASAAA